VNAMTNPRIRHQMESDLLHQADRGDVEASSKILKYLGSNSPELCRVMQETIRDAAGVEFWHKLLQCLALHRWDEQVDCDWRSDPNSSERIDQAIIDLFIEDEPGEDCAAKVAALNEGLISHEARLRWSAACLFGLRGDTDMVPLLEETIELGPLDWKLQAIRALGKLSVKDSGHSLVRALAMDRGPLHRAARLALREMGQMAEPAWMEALQHTNSHIRWHAARGLGELGKVNYAHIVAEGLLDSHPAVRWATADVLARLGSPAVPATLTILSQHKLNAPIREAAYHALNAIRSPRTRKRLQPLLEAMHGPAASVETPALAQKLLLNWELD
jgi:HEAT repeat protein